MAEKKRSSSRWILLVAGGICLFCVVPFLLLILLGFSRLTGAIWTDREVAALDSEWSPPPEGAGSEWLFPEVLGEGGENEVFMRVGRGEGAKPVRLGIELEGVHARYARWPSHWTVSAYRANEEDREKIISDIAARVEGPNTFSTLHIPDDRRRAWFQSASPPESGVIWWNDGWLIVCHSDQQIELSEFLLEYLQAIDGNSGRPLAQVAKAGAEGEQGIKVYSPNGGEFIERDRPFTIHWRSTIDDEKVQVKVHYGEDTTSNRGWKFTAPNSGSYEAKIKGNVGWIVYRVSVSTLDGKVSDMSDGDFFSPHWYSDRR